MENPISYAKHHKYIMGALIIIVVLATAVGTRLGKGNGQPAPPQVTKVSLLSAQDYLRDRGTISANGTVESLQQAELRSQASGPVTKIYAQIGQKVSAGQVLVTLQNSDFAAQLAQAAAGLKAQEARLEELKKGMRTEQIALLETKVNAAKQTLEDAKKQQDISVNNALSGLLNVSPSPIPTVGNAPGSDPTVTGTYTGTEQGEYKISVYAAGDGLRFQYAGLENGTGLITTTPTKLGTKGLYIQFPTASPATNNTWTVKLPNNLAPGYNAQSSAYQSMLQARDSAINGLTSSYSAAQQELALALAGATNEQIKAQQAAVDQARAQIAAIAAQLDKTTIRSPIKGTVAQLSVKYGELVSPGALVASVVSEGGLQVKAYISDYDLPYVTEGAEVKINDAAAGTLARISPSINPQTKNVEVQVLVNDPKAAGLVVGQNAQLKISAKQSVGGGGPVFLLPLQAVNIANSGASVFTVNEDLTLKEIKVSLGGVSGEKVEVKEGLTPDMKIVSTVYELKDGQKVSVE